MHFSWPARIHAAPALLAFALITGCVPNQFTTMTAAPAGHDVKLDRRRTARLIPENGICPLVLRNVSDQRRRTEELGLHGHDSIVMDDPLGWSRQVFLALPNVSDDPNSDSAYPLDVELHVLRVQTHRGGYTRAVALVTRTTVTLASGEKVQRVYRGRQTGINWFGSQEEVNDAIVTASKDLQKQFLADLTTYCESPETTNVRNSASEEAG
ncbi:hypothetical protein [uncultured Abyssibacter sp.]|uniref:hypothetical protein n=1 Tax=uncultured Abyssibacter sp. TaxID=2320202 RepID=UPI0032B12890